VLAEKLNNAGITAAYYHADMEPGTRAASHSAWSEGHVKVRRHVGSVPLEARRCSVL
jgi:superfamily II DNA helicase RecQ